jgi:hypothetical protein
VRQHDVERQPRPERPRGEALPRRRRQAREAARGEQGRRVEHDVRPVPRERLGGGVDVLEVEAHARHVGRVPELHRREDRQVDPRPERLRISPPGEDRSPAGQPRDEVEHARAELADADEQDARAGLDPRARAAHPSLRAGMITQATVSGRRTTRSLAVRARSRADHARRRWIAAYAA